MLNEKSCQDEDHLVNVEGKSAKSDDDNYEDDVFEGDVTHRDSKVININIRAGEQREQERISKAEHQANVKKQIYE